MEKGKAEEPGVEITDFHLVIYFTEMKMRTELQKWWKLAQLQWKIAHACLPCLPIFCISECIKYNAIIEQIQSQQEGETRWRNVRQVQRCFPLGHHFHHQFSLSSSSTKSSSLSFSRSSSSGSATLLSLIVEAKLLCLMWGMQRCWFIMLCHNLWYVK